jgi:hypothetical protein
VVDVNIRYAGPDCPGLLADSGFTIWFED